SGLVGPGDPHRVTGLMRGQRSRQVGAAGHLRVVDTGDHVACSEPGLRSRRAIDDTCDRGTIRTGRGLVVAELDAEERRVADVDRGAGLAALDLVSDLERCP